MTDSVGLYVTKLKCKTESILLLTFVIIFFFNCGPQNEIMNYLTVLCLDQVYERCLRSQ